MVSELDDPLPVPEWRVRLRLYWALVRGDRPIGWMLLLWPTWWGLWLAAKGLPAWWPLLVFTLGVWLTRSAGCVINDYADRWLDGSVERTRQRPLATGAVSGREALVVFAVLMLVAFALVLTLNRMAIWMSVVGVFLAATYPYLKRHTYLPQVYLGMAFGWGIPMAFAALTGTVPKLGWLLYVANIFWATAYDTWYAMVDRDDDIRIGIKTSALTLGRFDIAGVMGFYLVYLASWTWLGLRLGLGRWFLLGIAAALAQVAWHYLLIKDRSRDGCFKAFRENHWLGFTVFVGTAVDLALR